MYGQTTTIHIYLNTFLYTHIRKLIHIHIHTHTYNTRKQCREYQKYGNKKTKENNDFFNGHPLIANLHSSWVQFPLPPPPPVVIGPSFFVDLCSNAFFHLPYISFHLRCSWVICQGSLHEKWLSARQPVTQWKVMECPRGGGLGSRPKKIYGERLGDGVEYHLMSPTPRR